MVLYEEHLGRVGCITLPSKGASVASPIPCSYILVTKDELKAINPEDFPVHGGIAWSQSAGTKDLWMLGWDYGHPGDVFSTMPEFLRKSMREFPNPHEWTIEELKAEWRKAVEELLKRILNAKGKILVKAEAQDQSAC